jgi:RDD family
MSYNLSRFSIPKQILISLAIGLASYLLLFTSELINARSDWARLVKEHQNWVATGAQAKCNDLFKSLDQLEVDAGCRDKKFTEKDKIDQIFSCPLSVQQANPDLVQKIEINGCSEPGWKLVFRNEKEHPGQFWDWHANKKKAEVSHIAEYAAISSIVVFIFFISLMLWNKEPNPGWRRLSIVLTALATTFSTWYATTEFGGLDRNFELPVLVGIGVFIGVLASRHVFKWVQDGFNSSVERRDLQEQMTSEANAYTASNTSEALFEKTETIVEFIEPNRANGWDRAFARCIDLIPALVIGSLMAEILPNPSLFIDGMFGFLGDRIFWLLLNSVAIVAYDTVLLSNWGTTIGKSLFGIYIRTPEGTKLSAKSAYERAIQVVLKGLWLMLFFPWIQVAIGYSYIQKKSTPWDFTGRGWTYQYNIGATRRFLSATLGITLIIALVVIQKILKESARGDLLQLIL